MSITTNHHLSVGRADTCRESPSLLHSPRSELSFELWDLNPILKRNIFWSQYIFSENYTLHFFCQKSSLKSADSSHQLGMAPLPPRSAGSPDLWEQSSLYSKAIIFIMNHCETISACLSKWKYLSMLLNFSAWQSIEDLDLRGNNWQCDCHNLWMLRTLVPVVEVLSRKNYAS